MSTSNYYPGLNDPSTSTCQGSRNQMGLGREPRSQSLPDMESTMQNGSRDNMNYYGPNYSSSFYPDNPPCNELSSASSSSASAYIRSQYQRPPYSQSPAYYDPPFQPPSGSYYSHYYPPNAGEPMALNQGYPPHVGQVPWYQPPIGNNHEQMMNMIHFSNSNGREARNRAEKNRRDKLNGSIQELSTMVPHVAESPRRVDKTAVLRFSAHGLRVHYVFGKTIEAPPRVKPQVTDSLMKLLDSFLLTITCRGQIVLVSPSIEQHLGHCQTDLFGQNILHITHPDDHALLKKHIIPTDLETLFDVQPEDESGEPRPRTQEEEDEIDRKLREDKRNFTVRLARAGPRSEPTTYEIVKIDGCFRRADSAPRGIKTSTFPSGLQLIRRARGRDDSIPLHTISGNDIVLVAMGRVIKPPKLCDRLIEASHYEYKTRHLIDGRIIQCDQRISLVAGYMTDEVNGLSPFTFMHQDDVRWVIVALRQMYDCNSAYGESCYRLISRTGKFIYLRTRGYLEIDKETNKVHSFVCINTLVSDEEGKQRVQDMKNKFSIIINTKIPPEATDIPAAENPHQLERAIIYLIQNLQKSNDEESHDTNNDGSESDSNRPSKSPPLALIPPKACTIKSSITKSVNVVNTTAARYLHKMRMNKLKSSTDSNDGSDSNDSSQSDGNKAWRPSVLQRNNNFGITSPSAKNPKKRGSSTGSSADTDSKLPETLEKFAVKQEIDYDESRVAPLPDSKDYFELSTFTAQVTSQPNRSSLNEIQTSFAYSETTSRPVSVLKRAHFSGDSHDLDSSSSKRRNIQVIGPTIQELTNPSTDLAHVLPSSFEAIDKSLANIETVTTELKGRCSSFDVDPSSHHQLEEIIEEQQEQRELLENIQNEFQAHLQSSGPSTTIVNNFKDGNGTGAHTNVQQTSELKPR